MSALELSDFNSAAGHLSKALELYTEARRDDGAARALKRIRLLASGSSTVLGDDLPLLGESADKRLEAIATIAAEAIEQHLNSGARYFEINTEIQSMRECLEPGSRDIPATPTNGEPLPP
jgi:hypothetical protein